MTLVEVGVPSEEGFTRRRGEVNMNGELRVEEMFPCNCLQSP